MSKVILALCLLLAITMVCADGDLARAKWGHRHHNHHNHHSHHRHHPHTHIPHAHTPAPVPPAVVVPKMPCKMQTCKNVCVEKDVKLGTGKYAIMYKENVCALDAKCVAANKKCEPQLIALMKAAAAAEAALEAASKAKNAAKGDHAKAKAAEEASAKELGAAKAALDAAQQLVDEATSAAATAKAQFGENSRIYTKREEAAQHALKTFHAIKKEHLHAQAGFKGAGSAEDKAYKAYEASLAKHCDAEARFAAIVASIGHPIKEAECKGYKGAEKRFTIGSQSKSCTKCVSGGTGYTCAKEINKSNWAGSDTYPDRFQVSYSGDKICVKRVDAKGLNCHGWGMNLRFNCHQGIQTSATAMPCNMKVCNQICTEKKSSLDFHKYSIGYDVMECVDDTACINANNKCRATLMGVMKAAQDAEVSLKGAADAKAKAKNDHAKAEAATAAAKAEMEAAKKAMDAAEDEFKAAETAAAAAKASKVSSQKASSAADSKLEAQVKAYDAAKKSHLESQAAYHGAKSKAAEALKKYNEAVKKHCDYESLHTKLVKQINHGHLATNECGKDFACPEGYKPYANHMICPGGGTCCGAGWTKSCGQGCAKAKCDAFKGEWIPLNYSTNPYTCKTNSGGIKKATEEELLMEIEEFDELKDDA